MPDRSISIIRKILSAVARPVFPIGQMLWGSFTYPSKGGARFQGAFESREAAISSVPSDMLAGYNHDPVVQVSFDKMCQIAPWDYPVMFWLERLLPGTGCVLDAGGHMGTKYRAFRRHLRLDQRRISWIIYDLPAIVGAGRRRAAEDGLSGLTFVEHLTEVPSADIKLASGLLQYLDVPYSALLKQLPSLPRHLIINKVALREGETIYTLENFGVALVPYQIRNRQQFLDEIREVGYRIEDEWSIPALSHKIPSHTQLGASQSAGFYLTLDDSVQK